jgi:hypothetical protein
MAAWGVNGPMLVLVAWGVLAVAAMTAGLHLGRRWLVVCGLVGQLVFLWTLLVKIGKSL